MRANPEYQLCKALSTYIKAQYPKVMFHFDQAGNNLSKAQSGMNKAIQKQRGFPDLQIMEARGGYHGLFIEIKADGVVVYKKDGTLRKDEHLQEQDKYLTDLFDRGYQVSFGIGFDDCKEIIDRYLNLKP